MKRTPINRKPKMPDPDWKIGGMFWPYGFITEKQFQSDTEKLASDYGWWTSHSHLPFFDTAGWPDLAMVHPKKKRFMVRELKVTDLKGKMNTPSPTQWRWLAALKEAGVDADVWTWPHDKDRIDRELSA